MNFESTLKLVNKKEGKSNNKSWYLLQFLDNEDKHINIFSNKEDYDKCLKDKFYIVSFNIYYNLKQQKYFLSGKVVKSYEHTSVK